MPRKARILVPNCPHHIVQRVAQRYGAPVFVRTPNSACKAYGINRSVSC